MIRNQTVLVTGVNGFVGAHVMKSALDAGYRVRGTVRSTGKIEKIEKQFSNYNGHLEFAIVDLKDTESLEKAMKGIDFVLHIASPVSLSVKNIKEELLDPAIEGTLSVLKAAAKQESIKRIGITSSFVAVMDHKLGSNISKVYTESDWNPITYEQAISEGGLSAYCASKKLSEKAAFDFVKDYKPPFDLFTICPPMIYGPSLLTVDKVEDLGFSLQEVYNIISGKQKDFTTPFPAFVDVRDVADAHVKALTVPSASNSRYLVSAGLYSWQQVLDCIRTSHPHGPKFAKGPHPGERGLPDPVYSIDSSKAKRELGINSISFEKCFYDTIDSLLQIPDASV